MEAIRAELAESLARHEREREELLERIAALDAEADEAAEEEQRTAILTLDDLPDEDRAVAMDVDSDEAADPGLEFTESDFERVKDDGAYCYLAPAKRRCCKNLV
jgi:hypothetical protein